MYSSQFQSEISPAKRTLRRASISSGISRTGPMPLSPRSTRCHRSAALQLSAVTAPIPVTTTRRFIIVFLLPAQETGLRMAWGDYLWVFSM
jgi:hypothetical protein